MRFDVHISLTRVREYTRELDAADDNCPFVGLKTNPIVALAATPPTGVGGSGKMALVRAVFSHSVGMHTAQVL